MLFNNVALAQSPDHREATAGLKDIKPLKIGDTIPEALWHVPLQVVNHPDGKDTVTLNDYRDKKLIVLDFWSTYCGSCYYTFPVTFKKVEPYTDGVALIPMTYQERQVVVQAVDRNEYLQSINGFYTVVGSTWFRPLFGVDWFPQLIIMDNGGKILGHLRPRQLDETSLVKLLQGHPVTLPTISHRASAPTPYGKSGALPFSLAERREK